MAIRTVNAKNLKEEFGVIRETLRNNGTSYVSLDTEFPGVVYQSEKKYYELTYEEKYGILRDNVNQLKLIQLGLTISDPQGTSPTVWEFNFSDFDIDSDRGNIDSINLLKNQGIDFLSNRKEGIRSVEFANEFLSLRLCNGLWPNTDPRVSWIFFDCYYDIGYLIKVLTQKPLPQESIDFLMLVRAYLGTTIYDVKEIVKVKPFGWHGGLSKVADYFNIKRKAGKCHQAGSDSLLTLECFFAALGVVIGHLGKKGAVLKFWEFNYVLNGFAVDQSKMVQQQNLMLKKQIYQYPSRVLYHPYHRRPSRVVYHPYRIPLVLNEQLFTGSSCCNPC